MQYRKLGRTGVEVSALGFGCMRFPTLGARDRIDEPLATRMLHHAIDNGVNYLDSGYGYHGGNSERFLGRALKDGYREKINLATKLPFGEIDGNGEFDRVLNEQLSRLQTDHIDFYLLHGLRDIRWKGFMEMDVIPWAEKAKADGRIGHFGFSFHDTNEAFKSIIDTYDGWEFCQVQYNYMNEEYQAGTDGIAYAAAKGLGVIVMEPLLGGKLVNPPPQIQAIWDASGQDRSAAEWALQWVWSKPEVSMVLSGMSTMEQVVQNLESADRSRVGLLGPEGIAVVAKARDTYAEICPIPCTSCNYCMPCPNGVDIPGNFVTINNGVTYGSMDDARSRYARRDEGSRASACIQCRICEEECPQNIVISQWMPIVHQVLGEGQEYDPQACAGF